MKKQLFLIMGLSLALTLPASILSFAAEWKQDSTGWWWSEDNGSYPANQWKWIDGNGDGIAESYYFDSNGYVATNTVIDGCAVNSDGAWVVDGVVQTQAAVNTNNVEVQSGFIKQEYFDLLGKDKSYVSGVLGNPGEVYESDEYDFTIYEYTLENSDQLDMTFYGDKLEELTYFIFEDDSIDAMEIVTDIENQLGMKALKVKNDEFGDPFITYEWKIESNPSVEVIFGESGWYSISYLN